MYRQGIASAPANDALEEIAGRAGRKDSFGVTPHQLQQLSASR